MSKVWEVKINKQTKKKKKSREMIWELWALLKNLLFLENGVMMDGWAENLIATSWKLDSHRKLQEQKF